MKRKHIWITTVILSALLATYVFTALASGTESDPLISLSYLRDVFKPEVKTELTGELAAQLKEEVKKEVLAELAASGDGDEEPEPQPQPAASYEVVQLSTGQSIVAKEAAELVLRSGTAASLVPASAAGGLSDLTAGTELGDGQSVAANHLYLVSRGDGRGFIALTGCFVMVRGAYEIR